MSGQDPAKHAQSKLPKNMYGKERIAAHLKEKARRRDKYEQVAIAHDQRTKRERGIFGSYASQKKVNEDHIEKLQAEIDGMAAKREALKEKIRFHQGNIAQLEEKSGETARKGEKAAAISAKYEAYLNMETDELNVEDD